VIDAPFTRSQFKLFPRVPEAIRLLNDLGLGVAIVSNQPGIAKGHLKPEVLKTFDRMTLSRNSCSGWAHRWHLLLSAPSGCQRPPPPAALSLPQA